jgi:AcrR family transcriptional regulator
MNVLHSFLDEEPEKGRRPVGRARGRAGRSASRAARRRRYHHGNLRQALVKAALELVRTEGAEGLTLRAAARRAGVSQAAPYRHFADKDALLAAVAEEGFRAMVAAMGAALAAAGDEPLARFRALGQAYVGFARGHRSHLRVMFGREVADRAAYPGLQEAAGAAFRLLVDAIADCQRAGLVRAGDPEELAVSAWSMVHGFSALLVDGQLDVVEHRSGAELADSVARDLFLGLGDRPLPAGATSERPPARKPKRSPGLDARA